MVVLQSMWKGPNHCWNFMESGSESATYSYTLSQIRSFIPTSYWIFIRFIKVKNSKLFIDLLKVFSDHVFSSLNKPWLNHLTLITYTVVIK